MTLKKSFYFVVGILMVVLGAAGIILPLLPTTPFLLLAALLFAKSSKRCHDWLLNQKHLGPYIHAWRNKTGLTVAQKRRIGLSFTVMMGLSFYFAPIPTVKAFIACVWVFWTTMLLRQKTLAPPQASTGE